MSRGFAKGFCYSKLLFIFFLSALIGDGIETLYVYFETGEITSRSSVVYGTFSLVWGIGGLLATFVLLPLRKRGMFSIFSVGFIFGAIYEYLCSLITEKMYGIVFWDYSEMQYNLEGRINLMFCICWGVAAVIWIKIAYPLLSLGIENISNRIGAVLTIAVTVFMAFDIVVSGMALQRFVERSNGVSAANSVEVFMDRQYPDEFIEKVYPTVQIVE